MDTNITANGTYLLDELDGAQEVAIALNDKTTSGAPPTGAWGNGTAYIQYLTRAGNWVDHPEGSFTANFSKRLHAVATQWRIVLSGATAPDLDLDGRALR